MSFILDALKKSENERQQQSGGEFSSVPTSPSDARPARWLWLLAALLAINVAVLLGILMRPDVRSTTAPGTEEVQLPAMPAAQEPGGAAPTAAASFADQVERARQQQPVQNASETMTEPGAEPAAEATPATSVPPTSAAASGGERIPTIEELRLSGSLQLPELHIDIHVFSENPAERFVFINMAKHREQSRLEEGPVVREITADGVILQYQGRSFLLSRE